MAYEKQTWTNGDVITADKLNHIEDGIINGGVFTFTATQNDNGIILNKTWREIKNAIENGMICVFTYTDESVTDQSATIQLNSSLDMESSEYSVNVAMAVAGSAATTFSTDSENGYPSLALG